MRDYRTNLQAVLKRSPATVNNALAAVNDLYIRRGLGPAAAARVDAAVAAPRTLDKRAQLRHLRAVQTCPSPRDQTLALVPFYAGARIRARSSPSTSTTSPAPPAKASSGSSAKANASEKSRSTHNYTPR